MIHKLKEGIIDDHRLYNVSICGIERVRVAFLWRSVNCKDCLKLRKSKWKKLGEKMK